MCVFFGGGSVAFVSLADFGACVFWQRYPPLRFFWPLSFTFSFISLFSIWLVRRPAGCFSEEPPPSPLRVLSREGGGRSAGRWEEDIPIAQGIIQPTQPTPAFQTS